VYCGAQHALHTQVHVTSGSVLGHMYMPLSPAHETLVLAFLYINHACCPLFLFSSSLLSFKSFV
jgi:hypothetical protein